MDIILALLLGSLFGFVLQKVGAANPGILIDMLRLRNLHLMKAILLGIGISSGALFILLAIGVIDNAHLSVKASYLGVLVGGLIFGLGWAISGFCPGTGLAAAGAGRKDAWPFLLGGLAGTFILILTYGVLEERTTLFDDWFGGKTTLAETGVAGYNSLLPDIPAILVAGVIAVLFIALAVILPERRDTVSGEGA